MFLKNKNKRSILIDSCDFVNFTHQPGFPGVDKTVTVALWSL
jgi:hypothetical protein